MKKVLSLVMAGILTMGVTGFNVSAMVTEGEEVFPVAIGVPTLTSVEEKAFEIEHDGSDTFSIIVSENGSTGFSWSYTISNDELVEFEAETITSTAADVTMPGAPSDKKMTFKALAKGVSTIKFVEKRSFEDRVENEFQILVYKTDDSVIIEEDAVVYMMDTAEEVEAISVNPVVTTIAPIIKYNNEVIVSDVDAQVVDGVAMVPLRATLEAMGYTITWNGETKSVEINKGAQWTSITIGKNSYFKNRMAAQELSSAPVIVNDRTLVPAEFFAHILSIGTDVKDSQLNFMDHKSVIHSGYIKTITVDEAGMKTLTLTSDMDSDSIELQVIIHTSNEYSFYQKDLQEGDFVSVVSSMMMTMSIPGQTTGYIVY